MIRISIHFQEITGYLPGFLHITSVERWLSTAGLAAVEFHFYAQLSENLHRADADLREKLIHQASDEQGDFHNRKPQTLTTDN